MSAPELSLRIATVSSKVEIPIEEKRIIDLSRASNPEAELIRTSVRSTQKTGLSDSQALNFCERISKLRGGNKAVVAISRENGCGRQQYRPCQVGKL